MSELKPCPFCGSSNTTLDYYEISCPQELGTIVVCNDCGASAKSIVDWNTRPIEDALTARIAELEMKIRHNALWQASEDAEERAHLEKLVPDLKKRIAELEEAQRWIPVKEKLPNLFETVLIWAYCDCDGYDRFDLAFNSGLVWVGTQQDIEYEDVTHWMPLPTPPEVTR